MDSRSSLAKRVGFKHYPVIPVQLPFLDGYGAERATSWVTHLFPRLMLAHSWVLPGAGRNLVAF